MFRSLRLYCLVTFFIASGANAQIADPLVLIKEERWQEAVNAYAEIVSKNSYDGINFYYLGNAQSRNGDCLSAAPSLQRALTLGVNGRQSGMRQASMEIVTCAASLGDTLTARKMILKSWREYGMRDFSGFEQNDSLAELRSDPEIGSLVDLALPNNALDRNGQWIADIDYFSRLIIETHPEPFHTADEGEWRDQIETLKSTVPNLDRY